MIYARGLLLKAIWLQAIASPLQTQYTIDKQATLKPEHDKSSNIAYI
ncbi:MAG: hypothetical protein KME22_29880 [Hassallia sp. WJT32-NPBG1]|nr:hypothetical protein [Hassallia sp. WJT32-NPBG1]